MYLCYHHRLYRILFLTRLSYYLYPTGTDQGYRHTACF
nr:MAG TPA: hypothetical protein [Bacteriophage sp.]DAH14082.1 MAG TPA: hypothetical protein [Caudoviricetes sp.]